MHVTTLIPALFASTLMATAVPAAAQQKLLPAQSDISFTIKQMGVPVQGSFKKFDAQVSFDADKLAALERENRELKRANDILRKASVFFAAAELDRLTR